MELKRNYNLKKGNFMKKINIITESDVQKTSLNTYNRGYIEALNKVEASINRVIEKLDNNATSNSTTKSKKVSNQNTIRGYQWIIEFLDILRQENVSKGKSDTDALTHKKLH